MKTYKKIPDYIAKYFKILPFAFLVLSCGTLNPHYRSNGISQGSISKKSTVKHAIFLIGDTGDPTLNGRDNVLNTLQYQLKQVDQKSTVVFLGDNIYPKGLNPDTTSRSRKAEEAKISRTLQALHNYKGHAYFIPGNHDWGYGIEGIRAQESFIENYKKADAQFVPNNGCPGPTTLNVGKNWLIIAVDSQWWIDQSFKTNRAGKSCASQTRTQVINLIENFVEKYSAKHILLAFHHSLYSNGNHGGYYSVKDHLFPLTNLKDNLYVPLPLVGSAYPIYRKLDGPAQDLANNRFQWFKEKLLKAVEDHDVNFFASGHEHSLAFYEKDKKKDFKEGRNYFILSGAGSKSSYARKGKGANFVYSHKGFAKLVSYENGSVAVEYWVPEPQTKKGRLVYSKQLIPPKKSVKKKKRKSLSHSPLTNSVTDSMITVAAGPEYEASEFKQLLWGKHYREAWNTKINVPLIHFNNSKQGYRVLGITGGEQTVTIIAEDAKGKKYVMRSVQKDPQKSLPPYLQESSVAVDITQDQISAIHPYGSLIIPTLASGAGVYSTKQRLGYIPRHESLELNVEYGKGILVMIESFANKAWFSNKYQKETTKVISSDDLWENMRAGKALFINQQQLIRSRLFDMYIGDWDRHARQWFWAKVTTDSSAIYEPIPIDRDNAFFKSDGLFPWLTKIFVLPKFQHFGTDIQDIEGMNYNAQYFDRWFMNELSKQKWIAIARQMQKSLTDSVINAAVQQWPPAIRELSGATFIRKLKARREKLVEFAKRYYDVLSKAVNVYGSNKPELFSVKRQANGEIIARRFTLDTNGNKQQIAYNRVFKPEETEEIRLYGFGGGDQFQVTGAVNHDHAIKVRIIGGGGKDTVLARSHAIDHSKKTLVYDMPKGVAIYSSGQVKNKTSKNPRVNRYGKRSFKYGYVGPRLATGYNENDGTFLGGGVVIKTQGFRKEPYAARHKIMGKIATRSRAFSFSYNGIFIDQIGSFDLKLNLEVLGPNYSSNFLGFGNETKKRYDNENFYEYRYDNIKANIGLSKELKDFLTIDGGIGYEYVDLSNTKNRFVTSPASNLPSSAFLRHHYGSANVGVSISTLQNNIFPKNGFNIALKSALKIGLNSRSKTFNRFTFEGDFYHTFRSITTMMSLSTGFSTNVGDFDFFQANTLGGDDIGTSGNVRGFLVNRFSGRSSLSNSVELRTKLSDFKSYFFPGSVGLYSFLDGGRVWADGKHSQKWHVGYGGGIWVSPLYRTVLTAGMAFSKEESLFTLSIEFSF
jgi:hypothetical protein